MVSWYELYKESYLLELILKNGNFTQYKLISHSSKTTCIKCFKNWI